MIILNILKVDGYVYTNIIKVRLRELLDIFTIISLLPSLRISKKEVAFHFRKPLSFVLHVLTLSKYSWV